MAYSLSDPGPCKWHVGCSTTLASGVRKERTRRQTIHKVGCEMEALLLIAIFLAYGDPWGGKAGW